MNIAALLFDVARRQPQLPAVSDGSHAWSYGEFARRISRLAGGLSAMGLEPGDRVMLCMENCAEFLEVLLQHSALGLSESLTGFEDIVDFPQRLHGRHDDECRLR